MKAYLFTSKRLGFRNWTLEDVPKMVKISANPVVMKHFPAVARPEQTKDFIDRLTDDYTTKAYCYFAVDELTSGEFIGFIGLLDQNYDVSFAPYTDIGWRIAPEYWNKGYATEGAIRCLHYGFEEIGLKRIISTAPLANEKSIHIMKKIGMEFLLKFKHPRLVEHPSLELCACYQLTKEQYDNR